ncbi:hypothetical protein CBR_g37687 [Chara braunii]|uniref:Uncharacterized protein n=1 Tax=Chara braunii TaxID=69332 RepID=A0A388JZU4_CHABU|nr:hypothetical protein CBR_g37687 [Chara braunii]|eukprot:GBG63329.1 hypothetical protein CBR_g37687 [Chara braunii]
MNLDPPFVVNSSSGKETESQSSQASHSAWRYRSLSFICLGCGLLRKEKSKYPVTYRAILRYWHKVNRLRGGSEWKHVIPPAIVKASPWISEELLGPLYEDPAFLYKNTWMCEDCCLEHYSSILWELRVRHPTWGLFSQTADKEEASLLKPDVRSATSPLKSPDFATVGLDSEPMDFWLARAAKLKRQKLRQAARKKKLSLAAKAAEEAAAKEAQEAAAKAAAEAAAGRAAEITGTGTSGTDPGPGTTAEIDSMAEGAFVSEEHHQENSDNNLSTVSMEAAGGSSMTQAQLEPQLSYESLIHGTTTGMEQGLLTADQGHSTESFPVFPEISFDRLDSNGQAHFYDLTTSRHAVDTASDVEPSSGMGISADSPSQMREMEKSMTNKVTESDGVSRSLSRRGLRKTSVPRLFLAFSQALPAPLTTLRDTETLSSGLDPNPASQDGTPARLTSSRHQSESGGESVPNISDVEPDSEVAAVTEGIAEIAATASFFPPTRPSFRSRLGSQLGAFAVTETDFPERQKKLKHLHKGHQSESDFESVLNISDVEPDSEVAAITEGVAEIAATASFFPPTRPSFRSRLGSQPGAFAVTETDFPESQKKLKHLHKGDDDSEPKEEVDVARRGSSKDNRAGAFAVTETDSEYPHDQRKRPPYEAYVFPEPSKTGMDGKGRDSFRMKKGFGSQSAAAGGSGRRSYGEEFSGAADSDFLREQQFAANRKQFQTQKVERSGQLLDGHRLSAGESYGEGSSESAGANIREDTEFVMNLKQTESLKTKELQRPRSAPNTSSTRYEFVSDMKGYRTPGPARRAQKPKQGVFARGPVRGLDEGWISADILPPPVDPWAGEP